MYFDRRLFRLLGFVHGRIALATLIGLAALPVALARLALSGAAIAAVFAGTPPAELTGPLLLIAALILLRSGLECLRDEVAHGTAARVKTWLRGVMYAQVLRLGPAHFDQARTGKVVLSLVDGVEQLETFVGKYLPQFFVALLAPFVIFGAMVLVDQQTALLYLATALVILVVPAAVHRFSRRVNGGRWNAYAEMSADFLDSTQGLPTLQVFGQNRARGVFLEGRAREMVRTTMLVLAAGLAAYGVAHTLIAAGSATALIAGAERVRAGELGIGALLVVLMLGVEVFRPLRDLVHLYWSSMVGVTAVRGVYDLLDTPARVVEPADAVPDAADGEASLRFEEVVFSYGGGRRPALDGVSFEVRPGETVAVVGPSGAGKSTLVNLILRFADPQAGRVLVGGTDVRRQRLVALRDRIAVVTQDTYLFHGTVAENLRLGKPDATAAELVRAAELANAHGFISALPAGYDTVVGERGTRLSGGQRQRLAIARALLKDAPILVLDEALSSVDARNEAVIQEALDRLRTGRTTLVIAHRLSSVAGADRIVVLEAGRVAETGTHAALLASGGTYARLMSTQATAEAGEATDLAVEPDSPAGDPAAARATPAGAARGAGPGAAAKALPLPTLWVRLFRICGSHKLETAATLLCGLAHSFSGIALGVLSALLVGRVVTGGDTSALAVALAVAVPLVGAFQFLDVWLAHDLAYRLLAEMRVKFYYLLDRLAPAILHRRRSGDLVSGATADIELIELFYAHTISPVCQVVVVPAVVLAGLWSLAPGLALVLLPLMLAVALTPLVGNRALERVATELRDHQGAMNAHMVDGVQGLRTLAAFNHGPARLAEIEADSARLGELKRRFARHQSVQHAAIESLIGLGGLAVLATGAGLVAAGSLGRADLPLATLLAFSAFGPVVSVVTIGKELMQTVAAARRYFAVEDEPATVDDGPGAGGWAGGASPRVEFDAVGFRYGPTEPPALDGVSFAVEPGQTVALVGGSGAGKTTCAHLLLRFWDPQAGAIRVDGRDLRDFTLAELRARLALVAQDTYLFNTSLWENLKLGRPGATDDEVRAAARLANVEEFVGVLPEGYHTVVGERGAQLSGGQRQRVAIARALLKDAPILVLDEATSHLDAVSEAVVREALDRLRRGRTTLVIAHRLSTIRDADRIVVLDHGRVAETGSHAELLARDGLYSALIAAQLVAAARGAAPHPAVPAPADAG